MTHYYITWQPDSAEAGHFFLTHIESENPALSLGQIMDMAFAIEEIDPTESFDLCSIIRTDAAAAVVLH